MAAARACATAHRATGPAGADTLALPAGVVGAVARPVHGRPYLGHDARIGIRPRLDVLAARAVDLACSGNIKAIGLIAERIEGRVGMRPGEVAPEDEARREDMQAVIESIVTAMVNAKIASADDSSEVSASDRTPVVIDTEAPRRLGGGAPLSLHRGPPRNRPS